MSYIFFKTENSVSKSWGDVAEGLNSRYVGPHSDWLNTPDYRGGVTDYEQKINSFVKIGSKLGLYKSPEKSLAIAVTSPNPGQTMGVKHLDIPFIKSQLEYGIPCVYFGYNFNEESPTQTAVVEKTSYFGRNPLVGNLCNLETKEEFKENISVAIWMAFYKIKNCDIYYCIINDNLLDSTIIKEDLSDIVSFKNEPDLYCVLTSHDGNFKDSVFNPTVDKRAKLIGDNIIVTDTFRFEIDLLGESRLHMMNRSIIPDSKLPDIELDVHCSLKTTINKNRVLVDLEDKSGGTLICQWITGTDLDYTYHESLRREFVIIKI
jgi:hypothetical protein